MKTIAKYQNDQVVLAQGGRSVSTASLVIAIATMTNDAIVAATIGATIGAEPVVT